MGGSAGCAGLGRSNLGGGGARCDVSEGRGVSKCGVRGSLPGGVCNGGIDDSLRGGSESLGSRRGRGGKGAGCCGAGSSVLGLTGGMNLERGGGASEVSGSGSGSGWRLG